MKFTITRINKQKKLLVSKKTTERFLERIAKDDAKQSIANFRMSAPLMNGNYEFYNGMKEWQHVMPIAEFGKDESDNLVFQTFNGLTMLVFDQLSNHAAIANAKRAASCLPMTFAAIEGADGRSLIVLVCVRDEKGKLPDTESDADLLYQYAYEQTRLLYQAQLGIPTKAEKPSLHSYFLLTLDPTPYYNSKAVPMRIAQTRPAIPTAPTTRGWATSSP